MAYPSFSLQANQTSQILEDSFYEDTSVKMIASEEGIQKLIETTYDKTKHKNDQCPITLEEFTESSNVIELPCGHVCIKKSLLEWLTESNVCPICRYELPSKEKSVMVNQVVIDEDNSGISDPSSDIGEEQKEEEENEDEDEDSDTDMNVNETSTVAQQFIPFQSFLQSTIQNAIHVEEQNMLQQAIYNSMIDTVDNTMDDTIENNFYSDDGYDSND